MYVMTMNMTRVKSAIILQPSQSLRYVCFMDSARLMQQAGGMGDIIQQSRIQYRFLIILMEFNVQSELSIRVKTCLSAFENYCQNRDRSCWQMDVIKNRLNSTMFQYRRKGKLKKTEGSGLNSTNYNVSRKMHKSIIDEANVEEREGSKESTLFEVFKVKIHSNERYNRAKTEYTMNRHNFKTFLKLKQVQQFNRRQNLQTSEVLERKFQLNSHRIKNNFIEGKDNKMQEIVVQLKKRPGTMAESIKKIRTMKKNVDQRETKGQVLRKSLASSKVIYSSKDCGKLKTDLISDNKSNKQISGWQIKEDLYFGSDEGDIYRRKSKRRPK